MKTTETIYSHCLQLGASHWEQEEKKKKLAYKITLLVMLINNLNIFFPLGFHLWNAHKKQTDEIWTLLCHCSKVYCKRRITSRIPKGQATNKQTSKSEETLLTEWISHCGSWLQELCCGLAFICKTTQDNIWGHLVCDAHSGSNRPYLQALVTSVCVTFPQFSLRWD